MYSTNLIYNVQTPLPSWQTPCPPSSMTLHTTAPTQMQMENQETVLAPHRGRAAARLPLSSTPAQPSPPAPLTPSSTPLPSRPSTDAALSQSSSPRLRGEACAAWPGVMMIAPWRGGTLRTSLLKSRSLMTYSCLKGGVGPGRLCLSQNLGVV